ncbi:MAG: hypothetical protein AAF191_03425 [Verrucomicrobiota bacterium]
MKKRILILASLALAFGLAACGGPTSNAYGPPGGYYGNQTWSSGGG